MCNHSKFKGFLKAKGGNIAEFYFLSSALVVETLSVILLKLRYAIAYSTQAPSLRPRPEVGIEISTL